MKRTLDSPPEHTNEHTPCLSESWSILVDDIQNVIVSLLDWGTKQALSLTSKGAYQRWHHNFIDELAEYQIRDTSFQSAVFSSLLKDGHDNYILRYLRVSIRRRTMNPIAALKVIASIMSTRPEVTSILTWIINIYFYNVEHGIVLDNAFDSVLLTGIIECASIAGFQWMQQQPWYDEDRLFPISTLDIGEAAHDRLHLLQRGVFQCGDARFFGYMANHTRLFSDFFSSTYPTLFKVIATNADGDERIFNWKILISTMETFQTQWQQLKNDRSDIGFSSLIDQLLNIGGERVVLAVWANVGNLWTELDTATQSRIKANFTIQYVDKLTLEHGYSRLTIETVLQIGFPAAPILTSFLKSQSFFDHISGKDPVLMDWLWSSNDVGIDFNREIRNALSWNLMNWMRRNINELSGDARSACFERAVKWLQTHPFKYSETLARLIRDNYFLQLDETLA